MSDTKNSYDFPSTGINKHVTNYIKSLGNLNNKTVVDIPAGDGRASFNFLQAGAKVLPFDLFPSFFVVKELQCEYADLQNTLPPEEGSADIVVSQEGIEHMTDQYKVFCEFNRVLKNNGQLILTTPNFSNMRNRLSMFLVESDYWKRQAPSEVDSIWFSEEDSSKLYFGHLFLMNIQKIRSLSVIAGFKIKAVQSTDISTTSLILALLFYPLLLVTNSLSYILYLSKNKQISLVEKKRIFTEQFKLNLNFRVLCGKHLFLILEKTNSIKDNIAYLKTMTVKD